MSKTNLNPINIGSIARGAAVELFEMALTKVTANITVDKKIPPRVKLIPLRSFAETTLDEANPVESEFLLRFKQGQEGQPTIALFAVDGTKYKALIMQSIKGYLAKALPDVPILA